MVAGPGARGHHRDLYKEKVEGSGLAGTTYEPWQRDKYHRSQQCLREKKEGDMRLEVGKPGIGGRLLYYRPQDIWEASRAGDERLGWSRRPTSAPAVPGGKPSWISRDKQVRLLIDPNPNCNHNNNHNHRC